MEAAAEALGALASLNGALAAELYGEDGRDLYHRRWRRLLATLSPPSSPLLESARQSVAQMAADEERHHARLSKAQNQTNLALHRLHDAVLALRLRPLNSLFRRLAVRAEALAEAEGKRLRVEITGDDLSLDAQQIAAVTYVVGLLVENAIRHGAELPSRRRAAGKPEVATLRLIAERRNNGVAITASDDGPGFDDERVRRLLVENGVVDALTARRLDADAMGRLLPKLGWERLRVSTTAGETNVASSWGEGLASASAITERLGGSLTVSWRSGGGVSATLFAPGFLILWEALLVEAGPWILAIPDRWVENVEALQTTHAPPPCLAELLGAPQTTSDAAPLPSGASTVTLRTRTASGEERRQAVWVHCALRRQAIFPLPLHPHLAGTPGVSGAAALGEGRMALVLDVPSLLAHKKAKQSK
ncbi:hypothetical protein CCP2SC5_700010 [Azospirillaceae bacterium]